MLIGRKSTAQHGLPGQARQRRGRRRISIQSDYALAQIHSKATGRRPKGAMFGRESGALQKLFAGP
jgi:hypothetical protein